MRYEGHNTPLSVLGHVDPRTEPGELLFPDRFSEAQVLELEKALGSYGTAGQLQQRPAPRGGGIFKDEWWQYADHLPVLTHRMIFADTAQKTGQENDRSCFESWGYTSDGKAVLIDIDAGRWEAPELLERARAFWKKHKHDPRTTSPLRSMKVEDKVSGTGLIQYLRRDGIPIQDIQRNRDKVSRAQDVAPTIESGQVILMRDCALLSDFQREVSVFPAGKHDDLVDPMMDAVSELVMGGDRVFFM